MRCKQPTLQHHGPCRVTPELNREQALSTLGVFPTTTTIPQMTSVSMWEAILNLWYPVVC